MREFGAHFLGTVYQCNARLLDTEMAASADGIPDHFNPLLQRGAWNHCGIGEEQQFMVSRNLHHCQVSEDFPFGEQSFLFVKDGVQQIVRVDDTFH